MDGPYYPMKVSSPLFSDCFNHSPTQLGVFKTHASGFDGLSGYDLNGNPLCRPYDYADLQSNIVSNPVEPARYPSSHSELNPISFSSFSSFPGMAQRSYLDYNGCYQMFGYSYPTGNTCNSSVGAYNNCCNTYTGVNHSYSGVPYQTSAPSFSSNLSARSKRFSPSYNRTDDYTLDIEKVKRGEDKRTTLMIRNIPNGYTRDAFVRIIDTKCKNLYDFLYLPMDQNTHCNMGYGYVNMINADAVIQMYENFNNCRWPHTKSVKICSICYGRLQSGTEDLLHYCIDWSVMTSKEKYHPLFFKPKKSFVNGKEVIEMIPSKPHIDLSMRKTI